MSLINNSNVCRTCLSQNTNLKPVFAIERIMDQQLTLCDMLMACTSVSVIKEEGLPENICLNCIEELRRAFSFKKMCENSDATLRNRSNTVASVAKETDSNYKIKIIKLDANLAVEDVQLSNWDEENLILDEQSDSGSEKSNDENCQDNLKEEDVMKNSSEVQDECKKQRKSYNCEECNEECLGLASYWKHMANVHGKNSNKCEDCDKEFKSQNLLTQHRESHHKGDKVKQHRPKNKTGITKKRNLPRTCDICNKTFRFHSNLERHKLIHTGEKPYLCNVCGKGFGQMSYLKIHSFIHTGEKPYKCQMCDKSFAAPGTLMTHVRIHTGERPHVCKICGKDFPQSGYLSAHIRTHTGEKPVECKVCHRRFNQSGRLVIHMRIHSGEKPYTCKDCGRSFAVKGTLKKHIRTHTGERPYVCSVCGQAFAQSGTLSTHMKVHRPKQ